MSKRLLLQQQGALGEAKALYDRVIEGKKTKALGREHPDTLSAMGNLATLLLQQGQSSEANTLLIKVVSGLTKAVGSVHPATKNFSNLISKLNTR